MIDPTEDTQPHPAGAADGGGSAVGGPASSTPDPAGAGAGALGAGPASSAPEGAGPASSAPEGADPGPSQGVSGFPLRADPDRPADSGWREPAWIPPRDVGRHRDRGPSATAIVVGLVLIAAGLYEFARRTFQIALPTIEWSSLWPLILIAVGGWILLRSILRR